jgi:hypothetical protein
MGKLYFLNECYGSNVPPVPTLEEVITDEQNNALSW